MMGIEYTKRESALGLVTEMDGNGGIASLGMATSFGAKADPSDTSGLDYAADAGWIERTPGGVWQLTSKGRGVI